MTECWNIEPGAAVGPIRLGKKASDYIAILGPHYETFRRTPDDPREVLAFDPLSVHLTVDQTQTVILVSVFRPRTVCLRGIQLLDCEVGTVARELRLAGLGVEEVDAGLWCKDAGVVLVEVDGRIDGVEVGRLE